MAPVILPPSTREAMLNACRHSSGALKVPGSNITNLCRSARSQPHWGFHAGEDHLHLSRQLKTDWTRRHPIRSLQSHSSAQSYSSLSPDRDISSTDRPLVVLLGWLGAKERYFEKYTSLWQSLGHETLGYRPATSSILLPPLGDARAAAFLQQVQAAQDSCPGRPTVYHIFSNAAFIFMGTMLRSLQLSMESDAAAADANPGSGVSNPTGATAPPAILRGVKGIILDSCPCRLDADIAARGFTAAALGEPADGVEERHPRMISAARTFFHPVLDSSYIARRLQEVYGAWETVLSVCPQLYLYSSADALIPTSEVRRFMKIQEDRGASITSKMWRDTKHCEHFRVYPEEYTRLLVEFMQRIEEGEVAVAPAA